MNDKKFPTLCLDFDGVIHDYREGWRDGYIYGEVTAGFFDWAWEATAYFKLVIYSSRSKDNILRAQMVGWVTQKYLFWKKSRPENADKIIAFDYVHEKPAAFLTIDDRSVTFNGDWSYYNPAMLRDFQPWMNREPSRTALAALSQALAIELGVDNGHLMQAATARIIAHLSTLGLGVLPLMEPGYGVSARQPEGVHTGETVALAPDGEGGVHEQGEGQREGVLAPREPSDP